jgi:hypothetical protein
MTVDCQWVENNLEALSCDSLDADTSGLARKHIESCGSCRKEVEALNAIDPLIKKHFQRQLEIARQPRTVQRGRLVGLSAAAVAIAAVLLFVTLPGPKPIPLTPVQPQIAPAASVETPAAPVKSNGTGEVDRTKPAPAPNKPIDSQPPAQTVVTEDAPDFLVIDAAGYSHTLDDYRGHVAVIALLNQEQGEATANFDNLYKTYGANPKFRFLGVTGSHSAKRANTTFPLVYNQGSKLFGAHAGEFVVVDERGSIVLRGSIVKDFKSLAANCANYAN